MRKIEWLTEAARLTDLAMEAAVTHAKPGIPEIELSGRMAAAFRGQGGEQMVQFVTATPMANPRTPVPWQNPTRRKLEAGDVLIMEISAAYYGYAGQSLRTFTHRGGPHASLSGVARRRHRGVRGRGQNDEGGKFRTGRFRGHRPAAREGFSNLRFPPPTASARTCFSPPSASGARTILPPRPISSTAKTW